MGIILCYIYDEMADFEISLVLHRLKNTGKKQIITVSEDLELKKAQSGLTYLPDRKIEDICEDSEIEGIIIPGGPIRPEQNRICPLVKKLAENGKLVAAICFAPQFLARAGILESYRYTTSCQKEKVEQLGYEDFFPRENGTMSRTVRDRNVITAQGYAFVDFAIEVCRYFSVFESREQEYDLLGKMKEI